MREGSMVKIIPYLSCGEKRYGFPIFYENMSRDYFLKILKYLRLDDKPNRVRSGPGADKFAPIRQAFENFTNQCQ